MADLNHTHTEDTEGDAYLDEGLETDAELFEDELEQLDALDDLPEDDA